MLLNKKKNFVCTIHSKNISFFSSLNEDTIHFEQQEA